MKKKQVTDINEMDMFAFYDLDAELRDKIWCSFQWNYISTRFLHINGADFLDSIKSNVAEEYAGPNLNGRDKRIRNWKMIYFYHRLAHNDHST
ncbi:hypothetical protein [Stenotrophomonas phage RAS14]